MARRPNRNSSPLAKTKESPRFVSRGGEKLQGALDAFQIKVEGRTCLDLGSSTGGFTDCLLKSGAKSVWAVDVGYGLIDIKLRNDPRVHLFERTNVRHLDNDLITERPSLITADLSFISLEKVFPKIRELLVPGGDVITLVKPQFEGTPKEVPGGFVKDEPTRQSILERARVAATEAGFNVKAQADSVIAGRKGNQETFFHLTAYEKSL